MRTPSSLVISLLVVLATVMVPAGAWSATAAEVIHQRIAVLEDGRPLTIEGVRIGAREFVREFYGARGFKPAWTAPDAVDDLVQGISRTYDHGLDPSDFDTGLLSVLSGDRGDDPARAAELDILLTDNAARLLYWLRFGKVKPDTLDPDWNLTHASDPIDIGTMLSGALAANDLGAAIESVEPVNPYYLTLQSALKSYREIASSGGWPSIPAGPTLKPGVDDPRIPVQRVRLSRSGDHTGVVSPDSDRFDDDLVAAVKAFQRRHGLDADGIVGAATRAAMNVTVEQRIDQIRVNLERARWVLPQHGDEYLVVNIAGFYVNLIRDGREAWRSQVIVGEPYHKTPIFRDQMKYIVLNPDWTVPTSIVRNEILPAWRRDPDYLVANHYRIVDQTGNTVDPFTYLSSIIDGPSTPFSFVQEPGPWNALGRIKFIFPNPHAVYLHDTPGQHLFSRAERTFSHGCIRVERPFELAELLLSDKPGWDRERIEREVASGRTITVHLAREIPVLLLYWTVDPDLGGSVRFYRDVYDRDGNVLDALEG